MITHRSIFSIAVPVMISNMSTPLIGVVDTAIMGRIPDPSLIGSVALSSLIFTFVFWAFGFLRMGTTGLTAQAVGAKDDGEISATLTRALLLALSIGVVLIILQIPIRSAAFAISDASPQVETLAMSYFDIRIWSAPAALLNYALLGWLIAIGKPKAALAQQLTLNISNMVLDAFFVLHLGMGVEGVALGTLIAEYLAAILGLIIAWKMTPFFLAGSSASVFQRKSIVRMLTINSDIMIRSLALTFVFGWFTFQGAKYGDITLAANAVLIHFLAVSAYFLDGFAFATEKLVGESIGAKQRQLFRQAIKLTSLWAAMFALAISILLFAVGNHVIHLLTVDPDVRLVAEEFLILGAITPIIGVWCFQLDGVFIGATFSREMRNSMLLSTALFLLLWVFLSGYGNVGLWLAFISHFILRAITLLAYLPRIKRSLKTVS
jgi:MATE family multidrug resistance protein